MPPTVREPHQTVYKLGLTSKAVCNPFGGLGLTGGIADIGGLYDCLAGIYHGHTDDSILGKYSNIRRQKYMDIVDPISSHNMTSLYTQDPDKALESDEFLKMCKRAESAPDFARELQRGSTHLQHDFTQYYRTTTTSAMEQAKLEPDEARPTETAMVFGIPALVVSSLQGRGGLR